MFFDEIRAASGVHDATFNRRFQTPLVPNFVGIFHSPKRNFDNSPGFQLQRLLKTSTVKKRFCFLFARDYHQGEHDGKPTDHLVGVSFGKNAQHHIFVQNCVKEPDKTGQDAALGTIKPQLLVSLVVDDLVPVGVFKFEQRLRRSDLVIIDQVYDIRSFVTSSQRLVSRSIVSDFVINLDALERGQI
jgi:hypothetical protein